jgi:hypothetical protein
MTFDQAGDDDFTRLTRDLRLGFDQDVDVSIVDTHHSKSRKLPIVAADREGWNTSVAWYAFNYHNHYSAFRFKKSIAATLLWPISGVFGRKHMSGHEADCPLPDVTNFVRDYWNRRPLEGFACFAGGWHMATTLRYLEAIATIDTAKLFDILMDSSRRGKTDVIDGNNIDFKEMSQTVGIPTLDSYAENVAMPTNRIIQSMKVDWFGIGTDVRPCAVEVVTMPGMLMPGPSGTGEVYVEPRDTRIGDVLGEERQLRWTEETKYSDPRWLNFVPVSLFRYFSREQDDYRARKARLDATPWSVSHAYNAAHLDATRFRFSVPNPLDAVLFVKWWLEAAIPCAEQLLDGKRALDEEQGVI